MQGVKEVQIEGSVFRLGAVGLVQTQVLHPEGIRALRNRVVLEAHLKSPRQGNGPPSETGSPDGNLEK